MKICTVILSTAAVFVAVFFLGCASSQPARMYVVSSPDDIAALPDISPHLDGASIGLTRIRIPKHLARSPIVTERDDVELAYSEFHYWGQPLVDNLADVVLVNLTGLLPDSTIVLERALYDLKPTYLVHLEILRLSGTLGDQAELAVRWGISRTKDKKIVVSKIHRYSQKLASSDHVAYVTALNQMMMDVSRDVAQDLHEVSLTPDTPAAETP